MIYCNFDHRVWSDFLFKFDMQWVMPCRAVDLFHRWRLGGNYVQGKNLWKSMLHATLWKNWLGRTNRVFRNKSCSMEEVFESIVRSGWSWCVLKWSSWEWHWKISIDLGQFSWERPPLGVLKLKLDGSFLHSMSRIGISSVSMDRSGIVVKKHLRRAAWFKPHSRS